jgi:hypothetical protein
VAIKSVVNIPARTNLNVLYPEFDVCLKSDAVIFNSAYVKIESYTGNKMVNYTIGIYKSREEINMIFAETYTVELDISSNAQSIQKQIYNDLKSKDQYKNAIDVLEEGQAV